MLAPKAKVHRVYHGLNADLTRLLDAEPPARPDAATLRILGVGRLVAKKGFDVLVEACALLRRRGVDLEATIVGEPGEHEETIRRLVAELGLAGVVELPGPMTQQQLRDEYRRASAFCLPCRVLSTATATASRTCSSRRWPAACRS